MVAGGDLALSFPSHSPVVSFRHDWWHVYPHTTHILTYRAQNSYSTYKLNCVCVCACACVCVCVCDVVCVCVHLCIYSARHMPSVSSARVKYITVCRNKQLCIPGSHKMKAPRLWVYPVPLRTGGYSYPLGDIHISQETLMSTKT